MSRPREEVARRGPGRHNGEVTAEQIEHDLELTRAEMGATLDAIGDKLSPGQVIDQALSYFRAGPGEYFTNLGRSAKQNPFPIALVGIGLTWLMLSGRRGERYEGFEYPEGYPGGDYPLGTESVVETTELPLEGGVPLAGEGPEGEGRMGQAAGGAVHRARGRVGATLSGLGHRTRSLRSRTFAQSRRLSGSARRTGARVSGAYRDHPLLFGCLSLAVGAAIAAALPRTRREDEVMGPGRDELVGQAKSVGQQEWEKTKETVQHIRESSSGSAGQEPREYP